MDLFWAGKGEGALSWIPKALDAISGTDDGNLYQWNEDEPPTIVSGKVVDTIDGDTIDVEIDGKVERVRLIGVDTPETVDPDRPVGYFGPEASNYTKTRLLGKTITIEVGLNDRDVYDRLLGYVFIGSNMFNEELLRGGYGKIMIIAPNDKYENIFEAAEEVARENKLGVWGEE
jgi:micrococcal nuclease